MFELLAKINLVQNVVHINVTEPSFGYTQVHSAQYEKTTYIFRRMETVFDQGLSNWTYEKRKYFLMIQFN